MRELSHADLKLVADCAWPPVHNRFGDNNKKNSRRNPQEKIARSHHQPMGVRVEGDVGENRVSESGTWKSIGPRTHIKRDAEKPRSHRA